MALPGLKREIDFVGKRYVAAALSIILLAVSIGALATRSLNFGIDFTGGVLIEVAYPQAADLPGVRSAIAAAGFAGAQVQNFGQATDVLIRVLPEGEADSSAVGDQVFSALRQDDGTVELRRVEFVGPQVGEELTESGGLAMMFALLMILAYIWFRFTWKFAIGSVAALVHDVLIVMGAFSVFQWGFDLAVLAAVLAVIGYSLNDTVVVFDRMRENLRVARKDDPPAIMNTSVNQMLGRTVITSVTTLLVLLSLLFLGGEAVRGFALALIVGVVVGTYSSIFVASTVALALKVSQADLLPPEVDDDELGDLP